MRFITIALAALVLSACAVDRQDYSSSNAEKMPEFSVSSSGLKTKNVEGFGGVIAESYSDSKEWWAPEVRPRDGAPNVIIFLLDDVGFAQVGSFGVLIETPNIDALAANGLRFNNFHTTALCSPSRATLLA